MKKTALMLAAYMVMLVCFTACGTADDNQNNKADPEKTTMSEEEKISFYNELAYPGDIPKVEATDETVLYRIEGSYDLVDEDVFNELINLFNPVYPRLYSKYGKYGNEIIKPVITFNFDATFLGDEPASVVDNTINVNVRWFNDNHDKVNVIVYYIVSTALDYNSSATDWLKSSINYYIAAEYSAYGCSLTGKYNGGDYKNGGQAGADFLLWISNKYSVNVVGEINRTLNNSIWFEDDFWSEKTGKNLEQLWQEYKVS